MTREAIQEGVNLLTIDELSKELRNVEEELEAIKYRLSYFIGQTIDKDLYNRLLDLQEKKRLLIFKLK